MRSLTSKQQATSADKLIFDLIFDLIIIIIIRSNFHNDRATKAKFVGNNTKNN